MMESWIISKTTEQQQRAQESASAAGVEKVEQPSATNDVAEEAVTETTSS